MGKQIFNSVARISSKLKNAASVKQMTLPLITPFYYRGRTNGMRQYETTGISTLSIRTNFMVKRYRNFDGCTAIQMSTNRED